MGPTTTDVSFQVLVCVAEGTVLGRPMDWPRGESVVSLSELAAVGMERARLKAAAPERDLLEVLCAQVEWRGALLETATDSDEELELCVTRCLVLNPRPSVHSCRGPAVRIRTLGWTLPGPVPDV